MSSLSSLEKKSLENFLQMSGGNVSNFTVRQLNEFVEECTGLDLDDQRFKADGEYKARRLRAFWKYETDAVVGKLIHALTEYVLMPENQPTDELKVMETRCREIAARLMTGEITSLSGPSTASAAKLQRRSSVFINYRRDDTSAEAQLVRYHLEGLPDSGPVFLDVASIPPAAKWPDTIRQHMASSSVVLVMIGPYWLTAGQDEWGRRRIDDEADWVRCELEEAFRSGKEVLPLLVRGGKLPPENALPPTLKELCKCQAIHIRRDEWLHDIKVLETALSSSASPAVPKSVIQSITSKPIIMSPAEIKRGRDVEQLRKVFHWIHLGVLGVYIERLGQYARATNAGVFMYKRLRDLLEDTRFYLSDGELRNCIVAFVAAFGNSQKYAGNMEPGEREGHFHMPGDIFQDRDQEKQVNYTLAQAEPLRQKLEDMKAYVAENYVEINLATSGEEGFKEYEEYEARMQAALKGRPNP